MYNENGKEITWETFGFGKRVDKSKIVTVINEPNFRSKPESAWWGSRTDAEYRWKHWCEDNDFRECNEDDKCIWGLADDTKILKVSRNNLDILNYIVYRDNLYQIYKPVNVEEEMKVICHLKSNNNFCEYAIDFNKIKSDRYDAVELMDPYMGHGLNDMMTALICFNGWDCESIVILNPEKIIFL